MYIYIFFGVYRGKYDRINSFYRFCVFSEKFSEKLPKNFFFHVLSIFARGGRMEISSVPCFSNFVGGNEWRKSLYVFRAYLSRG